MEEVIEVSNPRSVLPVKNRKYIRNTTEIHLAKRNIDRIENFDEFVNLEVLWLNGNRIRKLENLDENIRIKELYLQQNQISSLHFACQIVGRWIFEATGDDTQIVGA